MRLALALLLISTVASAAPSRGDVAHVARLRSQLVRLERAIAERSWDKGQSLRTRHDAVIRRLQAPKSMLTLFRQREFNFVHELSTGWPGKEMLKALEEKDRALVERIGGRAAVHIGAEGEAQLHLDMPYDTRRGIDHYAVEHGPFGERFRADVAGWHAGMKILDGGAGEARFFYEVATVLKLRPKMVAVGVKKPANVADVPGDFVYHEGMFVRDAALEQKLGPGTYDRIVDTLGAGSYTNRLSQLLGLYGRLLKPGGKLFLASESYVAHFKDPSGAPIKLVEYLQTLRGFDIEYADEARVALVRNADPLHVPRLRLVAGSMLDRTFQQVR